MGHTHVNKFKSLMCNVLHRCLAQSSEESFTKYYSALMPGIKSILISVSDVPDQATYCGETIECIGLIAEAVGMKTFSPDANDIIAYIMKSLVSFRLFKLRVYGI